MGQARHPSGCHHDQDAAATAWVGSGATTLRAHMGTISESTGRGDRGHGLLHRGDNLAQDAVRAVLHSPQHQAGHGRRGHGHPRLGVGHPAGKKPRDWPGAAGVVDQIPGARPRRQVHPRLRRGVWQRGGGGDPNPIRAPKANAYAERWVQTVRAECLDWTLVLGRCHLLRLLRAYVRHYNQQRPHRGLALAVPEVREQGGVRCLSAPERSGAAICWAVSSTSITGSQPDESGFWRPTAWRISRGHTGWEVVRRDRLGGLIHEYAQVA